jgi:hypothetical protein
MINFNYFPQSCAFCYLSKYLTTPKTVGYTDGICKSIKVEILASNLYSKLRQIRGNFVAYQNFSRSADNLNVSLSADIWFLDKISKNDGMDKAMSLTYSLK